MEYLFLVLGLLLGVTFSKILRDRERIHGVVHVDHDSEQCIFSITGDQLSNRKKKIAVFVINHDAVISREEQGL